LNHIFTNENLISTSSNILLVKIISIFDGDKPPGQFEKNNIKVKGVGFSYETDFSTIIL